ncbi:MAG: tetratricopeptide repeat protein [Bacteroidota bacterium]|nr:tetratricopeptide repeat protein [Bacteroidota bacterium]
MNRISYLFLFIFLGMVSSAQKSDSLWKIFNDKTQHDTVRLIAIDKLAFSFQRNEPDSTLIYAQLELDFAIKTNHKKEQARALNNFGVAHFSKDNYAKALDYYQKSLKIREELNDKSGIANSLNNIGLLYNDWKNHELALEYYFKALKIRQEIGEKNGIASCYKNIGSSYNSLKDQKKALEHYHLAVQAAENLGDKRLQSSCFNNIGNVYLNQHLLDTAIIYFLKAYDLSMITGDKRTRATCCINLGSSYLELKNYKKAMYYSEMALALGKELNSKDKMRYAYKDLSDIYANANDYKKAYNNYLLYDKLTDSIFNAESSQQFSDLKTQFEVEKKEAELKVKSEAEIEKQKVLAAEEKTQQRIITFSVSGILIVVIVFSFFLYKRFRITDQQRKIIEIKNTETEAQKHLIEEKQREIIDSLTYAKRLQQAILPPIKSIDEVLSENFVLYLPKDIIAGDFYWMHDSPDTIFIAVADCTGHGVPGAMVSVVCSNALNRAVSEFGILDTGKILDTTKQLVLETFEKSGEEIKDGMDISLLAIHKKTGQIEWSGANNPLWYISENQLHIIKADKQPVGKTDHSKPFTTQQVPCIKGSVFYLITDGYADQFGGPKARLNEGTFGQGKKFKHKQMQELLLSNHALPMNEQKTILKKALNDWKGSLEQVDDVCVIGIMI